MSTQPFPGVVSSVEAQERTRKHLGQRVNIYINGRFSFALAAELAFQHGLRPGFAIDAALLSRLLQEDGDARATATAMNFIGYRPRSSQEIRARLERDEWPEEVIERVIERLGRTGWLNDAQFAENWVAGRSRSKPRGTRLLKQELRQKGIAKEEIEAALPDEDAEIENAVAALQSKSRRFEGLEERERRQKAIEFLQRRGFSYGTAKAAFEKLKVAS
jgi:regulatory protein